jgi:hypothetical protein
MKTINATINAGVCGFVTEVTARCEDGQYVSFEFSTPCERVRKLAHILPPVDAFAEIGSGFDGQILITARDAMQGCCSGCAVPIGVFKAMQVAAGLALPHAVSMEFVRQ